MITYKAKISYINDVLCLYELYRHDIKCNDLFVMTLKRIISLDKEDLIFSYYYNFKKQCLKRYKERENN